jgi:hypothetical protein
MGATVTAVFLRGGTACIAQVGDSRAYLIRGSRIKQLTKDQSLAQALVDSGAITPDQMSLVPQNVIVQALGTNPVVQVALTSVELCRNDHLLICSDGLSGKVNPEEMCEIIRDLPDLDSACRRLVDEANERGGEDNITVIVARFDGEGLESANDSATITGSFKVITRDLNIKRERTQTIPLASTPPPPAHDEFAYDDGPDAEGGQDFQAGRPLSVDSEPVAYPDTFALPAGRNEVPETVLLSPQPAATRRKQNNRAAWILVFVLLFLLLAAGGYLYFAMSQAK